MKLLISLLALSLIITACNIPPPSDGQYSGDNGLFEGNTEAQEASIHTNFSKHFMIGTAVSAKQILGGDRSTLDLIKKEFNAITPENIMKWELIHPKPNVYEFKAADALVNFAEQNDIFLVGHTLVWHHMTPDWIFKDDAGKYVSREVLLGRLEEHINAVVGRYKNRIDAWDVVNEALNDDGSLRESNWLKIIGEDYIEIAFEMAAKAAPNAKLYYNDYSLTEPKKRRGAVRLIGSLQAKGVKIDGIGFQGHYGLTWPSLNKLEDSIKAFEKLGIDIFISELDVSVLPRGGENQLGADISLNIEIEDKLNPYPRRLPPVIEAKLARRYHEIFAVLNKHRDIISRVSVWGLSDENSWLNDWPVKERTDYPLLFDRQMKKKSFVSSLHLAK
ncbi:MAG: 1,4-beta-xylanase [Cellvibrionales bacterium]|nr:1,4-beta-xylanase [Cellvibrionales bacterium]|tara:strand:+ start:16288 stop:17454 length:1167 start_codon:yes stop_codon:yes gene_type:complete